MSETTRQITEYNSTAAILAELAERYANVVFPVATKDGMKDAKDVRGKLVKLRTGLEAVRKELKEPALRRTQAIDAEAKAITAAIKLIEEPIDAQIKAEEQRIEAEKAAKEAIEKARIDAIKAKIEAIRMIPLALAGERLVVIESELEDLAAYVPGEEFAEFAEEAAAVVAATIASLNTLHDIAETREIEEQRQEEERARMEAARAEASAALAAEKAELAAMKAALQAERDAIAAERAALQPAPEVTAVAVEEPAVAEPLPLVEEIEAAPVSTSDWTTRRVALATALQFNALADKVEACGVIDFANQLRAVAYGLREGDQDQLIAAADITALLEADNALIDATVNCIDALTPSQQEAA